MPPSTRRARAAFGAALLAAAATAGAQPATGDARAATEVPAAPPRRPASAAPAPATPPAPPAVAREEYAARRERLAERLAEQLGDSLVVVAFGAPEPDADYETFSQSEEFHWLTGFREPDAALVMVRRGGTTAGTLYVLPRDPAREVWTGRRAGPEGARAATGLEARPVAALHAALDSAARLGLPVAVVGDVGEGREVLSPDDQRVAALRAAHPTLRVANAAGVVAGLRGRKSAAELALVRRAADVTVAAHREAMRLVAPGRHEYEVQALIEYAFRRQGADRPSFASIVGSGPNSTVLHYNANDRRMEAGDLVVIDVGASWAGYAADVTRTLPVSGRFTPDQRAVYDIVRAAQRAAERAATVGAQWGALSNAARDTIAAGLARLRLIDSATATYDCSADGRRQCPQWSLYYMHGLGHGIGLEVHDPDQLIPLGVVAEGSAFTLEPGVYVRERLVDILPDTPANRAFGARIRAAVRRYANVGVRIEDDYVVTARGVEWVSRAPREAAEVEAEMRRR